MQRTNTHTHSLKSKQNQSKSKGHTHTHTRTHTHTHTHTHTRTHSSKQACSRNTGVWDRYRVTTISRLLKIISLFCRMLSLSLGSFAKETYNFKEPAHHSQPISWLSIQSHDFLRGHSRLKCLTPVISVKMERLPGNTKNRLCIRSWTARVRFLASWVDPGRRYSVTTF